MYASPLTRFETASASSSLRRAIPRDDHRTVPGVAGDHQALFETETRDRKRASSSHSRSSESQRKGITGGTGKAIGSSPRCYPGRPLPDLGNRTRHAGEFGHHEPSDPCCGLDTKQSAWQPSERAIEEEPLSTPKLFKQALQERRWGLL